jgi:hypothetical protein
VPSVTAAMTLVSFPVIEVAVLGRAVLGRPVPGVERIPDNGLLDGYGALCILEREVALAAVDGLRGIMRMKVPDQQVIGQGLNYLYEATLILLFSA